jgi:hypothetical protein
MRSHISQDFGLLMFLIIGMFVGWVAATIPQEIEYTAWVQYKAEAEKQTALAMKGRRAACINSVVAYTLVDEAGYNAKLLNNDIKEFCGQ